MKNKFFIGQGVQSHYRARWYGVVMDYVYHPNSPPDHYCCRVLVLLDKAGNMQRKLKIHTLDAAHLTAAGDVMGDYLEKKLGKE